jgi:hypothetical protein
MAQITTVALKTTVADTIMSFLTTQPSYLFYGKHTASENDTRASDLFDNAALKNDLYKNMIEGAKISGANVSRMIANIPWQSGKVFPCYTPQDTSAAPIHVLVVSGVDYLVYKCISNNNGAISTFPPSGTLLTVITTPDGYVWKYMGTISQAQRSAFETDKYVPYKQDAVVVAGAVPSALDRVEIVSGGFGYRNSYKGTFRAIDLVYGTVSFQLGETAHAIANMFVPCVIMITTPGSPIERQYRTVTGYTSGRLLTVALPFSQMPVPGDTYEVTPRVLITSTNPKSIPAFARAIIGPTGTITNVEVLSPGANLLEAKAFVDADPVVGIQATAVVTPVLSPGYGHGGNPMQELLSTVVGVSATFDQSNVIKTNDFRQYGVVCNPLYDNVVVRVTPGPATAFTAADKVIVYRNRATANGTVVTANNILTGTGTTFLSSVKPDDYVRVANNSVSIITTVASVANNTSLTLGTNVVPSISGTMGLVEVVAMGLVSGANTTHITVTNVSGVITAADRIYGTVSRTDMSASTGSSVTIGGRSGSPFSSFTQASSFVGSVAGSYVVDEIVSVGAGRAAVHSANSTHLYMTNVDGAITTGNAIGSTSGATLAPSTRNFGDLVRGSGEIVFVATTTPVTRTANNKQQITICLEF